MTVSTQLSNTLISELNFLGIDEKKLAALPDEVRTPLLSGGITPLLAARIDVGGGHQIMMPVKLQIVVDRNGERFLLLHPLQKVLDNKIGLQAGEIQSLRKGAVISKILNENGVMRPRILQYDPELNTILKADPGKLRLQEKLNDLETVYNIKLGDEQKSRVREGKPVELKVGDHKVTMGLDLRQPDGFRQLQGDLEDWKRQLMKDYDEAHPEYRGYVMTDKNEWEYAQVVKAQSGAAAESNQAKEELSRKSGFRM